MKKHKLYFSIDHVLLFFLGSIFFLAACQDEEQMGTGAPVIERVRLTDTTQASADTSLSQATLGSTIAIVGQNLASAQYVYLNDYEIPVNSAYATDQYLIVQVVDSVPTVATRPNVSNQLRVVTPYGQATYEFQTLPPAPVIEQISNQYVQPGQSITLYGNYFYFVDTVYFPGEVAVTEGITANGNTLSVTVPQRLDFSEEDDIVVVTQSGTSASTAATQLYDGNGMVADFDTDGVLTWPAGFGWGIQPANVTNEAPGIQPLDNNFARMNMELPPNYGWSNDLVVNLVNWGGEQIYPTAPADRYSPEAPIANFVVRTEVAVSTASSIEGVILRVWTMDKNGTEIQTDVPLTDFVRTTDGKWYTVTVPLANLANGPTKLATYGDALAGNPDGQHHLRLHIFNTNPDGSPAIPAVIGIDNVRVVNTTDTAAEIAAEE